MALPSLRLRFRRALSLSSSLLHSTHLQRPKPISSTPSYLVSVPTTTPTHSSSHSTRLFTSTATLFRKTFDPETDEIGPDTILFEGCDYNHWLITVDFPKDGNLTRDQMIETYVNIASQVFGSVEDAKKKIYALSTTTYQGFQVQCSEETSEKFKSIPGVVFVLPDSYIDPVNKEYGGDKYVNGEIFPRPPPVHYGRRSNRDRNPRDQMGYQQRNAPYANQGPPQSEATNYGPPSQQNYRPPPRQSYGPPPQQNYGPPPQQNYEQPPRHNYGPPPQQNYGQSPQQNYGSPSQQTYRPPHQQNYGQPPQWQGYGSPQQSFGQMPQQSYGPPPQQNQNHVPPPQQSRENLSNPQNYSPRPSHSASGHGEINPVPSHQEGINQAGRANHFSQEQRYFQQWTGQSDALPEQRGFRQDAIHESARDGGGEQVPSGRRNFTSMRNNW